MNQYPQDHPLWLDVNCTPEWLYQYIQDPEKHMKQQSTGQGAPSNGQAPNSNANNMNSSGPQGPAYGQPNSGMAWHSGPAQPRP